MNPARAAVSAVAGAVIGAGLYALILPEAVIAVTTAVVYAGASWATLKQAELATGVREGPNWWAGLSTGLAVLAAIPGIQYLPLATETRVALGVLILGVAFASFNLGVGSARTAPGGEAAGADADAGAEAEEAPAGGPETDA